MQNWPQFIMHENETVFKYFAWKIYFLIYDVTAQWNFIMIFIVLFSHAGRLFQVLSDADIYNEMCGIKITQIKKIMK